MLCELFKNNGPSGDKCCYRDILLVEVNAKPVMNSIREILVPHAKRIARESQFGSGFICASLHSFDW